jgi:hypothetical protein
VSDGGRCGRRELTAAERITPDRDGELEVGVAGGVQRKRPTQIVAEAAQWLLRNHHRWETFVEDDKDVQGTAWEHMAYALGVQAVLRAGGNPHDPRLAKAWPLMNDLWDAETGMWNEPGASGRRATIRAAFYTVTAYEEARLRISQMSMAEQARPRGPGALVSRLRKSRSVRRGSTRTLCGSGSLPTRTRCPARCRSGCSPSRSCWKRPVRMGGGGDIAAALRLHARGHAEPSSLGAFGLDRVVPNTGGVMASSCS